MYEVRESPIHGRGLFAKTRIPADTVIGTLEGEAVNEDGPHVLWLDDETGFRVSNDLKYINHATPANAAYYDDLTVATLVDIRPGEEITHDYDGSDGGEAGGVFVEDEPQEDPLNREAPRGVPAFAAESRDAGNGAAAPLQCRHAKQ